MTNISTLSPNFHRPCRAQGELVVDRKEGAPAASTVAISDAAGNILQPTPAGSVPPSRFHCGHAQTWPPPAVTPKPHGAYKRPNASSLTNSQARAKGRRNDGLWKATGKTIKLFSHPSPQTLEIAPRFPHSLRPAADNLYPIFKPRGGSLPQLPIPLTFRLTLQLEKTEQE